MATKFIDVGVRKLWTLSRCLVEEPGTGSHGAVYGERPRSREKKSFSALRTSAAHSR